MKKTNHLPALLLALPLLGSLLTTSCNKPQLADRSEEEIIEEVAAGSEPVEAEPVQPRFPLEATIRNKSGKALPGRILGKSGDEIAFQRNVDGNQFVIPLANLHLDDQSLYREFPDQDAGIINSIKEAKLQVVNQTRIKRPSDQRRRPLLGSNVAPDYEAALKRAEESGTNLLVIFMAQDELPADCNS